MGTRDVRRCARARAGGSARARRKLNQGPRRDVYINYPENPHDYSQGGACYARHALGLIAARIPSVPTIDEEHIVRDTHWG